MPPKPRRVTIWEALAGSVWHATSLERAQRIVASGSILKNPPLADSERWHTGQGPEGYPFVRKIGGISLFDFARLRPDQLKRKGNGSSWLGQFIPVLVQWDTTIWIEIDVVALGTDYLDAPTVAKRLRHSSVRGALYADVEAASLRSIPVAHFKRLLEVADGIPFHPISLEDLAE